MVKPRLLPLVTALLVLTQVFLLATGCTKKIDKQKEYAAVINDNPITRKELAAELDRIKQRFYSTSPMSEQQASQIENEILEIMIGGELLYQASQKEGIQVTDKEIKDQLAKSKAEFPDTEKFKNTFTEQEIKKKIATEKYIAKKFAETTTITDDQARKYYETNLADFTRPEQVLVSHILLKVKEEAGKEDKDKAMATLKGLQAELDKGADFAELAKKHSEDTNAASGGVMGFVLRGQTEKPFEEAAFGLESNKTAIVETKSGLHLIKASDKKPTMVIPFEDVSEKLRNFLKQQEIQKKIDTFIKEERKKAKLEVFLAQWTAKKE